MIKVDSIAAIMDLSFPGQRTTTATSCIPYDSAHMPGPRARKSENGVLSEWRATKKSTKTPRFRQEWKKWIMFTIGSVGRHYRSIYRLTLGRCINWVSTATWPTYRPQLSRVSVEYRSSISWLSVEHHPIYRRMCVSTNTVLVSSTLGR